VRPITSKDPDSGAPAATEARLGDLVGFWAHSTVPDPGFGTTYTIVENAFGRLMGMFLHGDPSDRRIAIQSVVYIDAGIYTDPGAADSDRIVGGTTLVR
jgi:hypothetical protein